MRRIDLLLVVVGLTLVSGQECNHGDIRLIQFAAVNNQAHQGRVEICLNGVWGTITDDGWDSREAKVVCRQLGFSDTVTRPYRFAFYGQGVGLPILMDNIRCQGNEERLIDCPYATPVNDYHSEDVGIRCYTEADLNSATCNSTQARLVGGATEREGRLEVCMGGVWGTVVDDGFSTRDAQVICRQLGYVDGYGLTYNNQYYTVAGSSTPIYLDNVACSGSEANVFDCVFVMAQGDYHSEDIGVKCFDQKNYPTCTLGDLRLVNGNNEREGRIEICFDGSWGTICDDGWSTFDAYVACRQLGFATFGAQALNGNANFAAGFGRGTDQIWIDVAACNSRELRLTDCNMDGNTNEDNHNEDAGLRCPVGDCTEGQVRLMNGANPSTTEGRVELCYGGFWSTVCDRMWGIQEAQVVCAQLGYTQPDQVFAFNDAYYGSNTALPIRVDDLRCTGTEVDLIHCTFDTNVFGCSHSDDVGIRCTAGTDCTHGALRLVGGSAANEGRLEVCWYGIWGTVTDDNFGTLDALVACKQLGYYDKSGKAASGMFPTGTGIIHMDNVGCIGTENSLINCPFSRDTSADTHGEDVGVICLVVGDCTDGAVRLASGNTPLEGRVEVCRDGVWGTVSDSSWGGLEAQVVCRQLGYLDGYGLPYGDSFFGDGSGPVHYTNFGCTGSEMALVNCSYDDSGLSDNHAQDASVRCFNQTSYPICDVGAVRLVGGNSEMEGRAEICINGTWGSVCDQQWSSSGANVLCGQLGYASIGATAISGGTLGQGYGPIAITAINCSLSATSLLDCKFDANTQTCSHSMDAGVMCLPTECTEGVVRLVNGSNAMEGRVEVCRNKRWATVCDARWGINDAKVVCRQLGYSTDNAVGSKQAAFGQGTAPVRLTNVNCAGTESSLLSCPYDWNTTSCSHANDAGVSCLLGSDCRSGSVRLIGGDNGYEGQVQFCLSGRWGTVSNDGWGTPEAQVVCKQLGHSEIVGVAINGAILGGRNLPIAISSVNCTGRETALMDCSYNVNTENRTHSQDAGAKCFASIACTSGSVRLQGGADMNEGVVELCIGGEWGTVGNYGWDNNAAQIVCNQLLGHLVMSAVPLNDISGFSTSQEPILIHSVQCSGSEATLLQCGLVADTASDTHATDAGLRCIPKVPVVTTSLVNVVPTVRPEAVIDGVPAIAAGAIIGIVLVVVVVALIIVLFALLMSGKRNKSEDGLNLIASARLSHHIDASSELHDAIN